jgi:hypothetical protein
MSVLVATSDGYHIFTSKGQHLTSLEGHALTAFAPGHLGSWLGIVDGHGLWQHAPDGTWSALATSDARLTWPVAVGDADVLVGTADARVLRLTGDALTPLTGFDETPGRDEWHQVGSPLCVRSMTATADGAAILANVHVGGIPRSTDGGASWQPTIAVDDDVHQVLAHPTDPAVVVAAASVGLCRSTDGGETWTASMAGMHASYARAVTFVGDDVLVSVSDGPFTTGSAIYRASVAGGEARKLTGGLPEWLSGNIDTGCLAANAKQVALADGDGNVWASPADHDEWALVAEGIPGVRAVAVA